MSRSRDEDPYEPSESESSSDENDDTIPEDAVVPRVQSKSKSLTPAECRRMKSVLSQHMPEETAAKVTQLVAPFFKTCSQMTGAFRKKRRRERVQRLETNPLPRTKAQENIPASDIFSKGPGRGKACGRRIDTGSDSRRAIKRPNTLSITDPLATQFPSKADDPPGLSWRFVGATKPMYGQRITSVALEQALKDEATVQGLSSADQAVDVQVDFDKQRLLAFGCGKITYHSYAVVPVQNGTAYFTPLPPRDPALLAQVQLRYRQQSRPPQVFCEPYAPLSH